MDFKRSGKNIFGVDFNAREKKALDIEIRKVMADYLDKVEEKVEAQIIWQIMQSFPEMDISDLKAFYMTLGCAIADLINHYEMAENDGAWLADQMLKANGIDIHEWSVEKDTTVGVRAYKK